MASCTPSALIAAAKCFPCLTKKQLATQQIVGKRNVANRVIGGGSGICVTPSAPTRLALTHSPFANPSSTTIQISWAQKNSGSFITGYKVSWGTTSGGPYTNNSGTLPSLPRNYLITGLTPGTTYFIVVQAIAFAGCVSPNSAEFSATTTGVAPPPALPQLANLVLKLESTDFDGTANGTALTVWNDHSGLGNNLDHVGAGLSGNPAQPTVDGATLCNGHKTVRFDGTMGIGSPNQFITGVPTGAEMMIVFVNDADPPTGVPANANGAFFQLGTSNAATGSLNPFTDSNFYESFWTTTRPNIGNPATSTAGAFCCYNVSVKADNTAFNAWINSENFFTSGAYTFSVAGRSPTTIGCWFTGVTNLFGKGNVAAAYMWQVPLSAAERTQARAYITSLWGVAFP